MLVSAFGKLFPVEVWVLSAQHLSAEWTEVISTSLAKTSIMIIAQGTSRYTWQFSFSISVSLSEKILKGLTSK